MINIIIIIIIINVTFLSHKVCLLYKNQCLA